MPDDDPGTEDARLLQELIDLLDRVGPRSHQFFIKALIKNDLGPLMGFGRVIERDIPHLIEALARLETLVRSLHAVKDTKVRAKQLDTVRAGDVADAMLAENFPDEQVRRVVKRLMLQSRPNPEAARKATDRIMAGKRPDRQRKDKKS